MSTFDHEQHGWHREGDVMINDAEEEKMMSSLIPRRKKAIPSKLRAVIKFGYEESMKNALGDQNFDSWIAGVLIHTQVHFMRPSLGTQIMFEVRMINLKGYIFEELIQVN